MAALTDFNEFAHHLLPAVYVQKVNVSQQAGGRPANSRYSPHSGSDGLQRGHTSFAAGGLRPQRERQSAGRWTVRTTVGIHHIAALTDFNEYTHHLLQAVFVHNVNVSQRAVGTGRTTVG
eukprot:464248_1